MGLWHSNDRCGHLHLSFDDLYTTHMITLGTGIVGILFPSTFLLFPSFSRTGDVDLQCSKMI